MSSRPEPAEIAPGADGAELARMLADAAGRLAEVVAAAERAARETRAQTERQAEQLGPGEDARLAIAVAEGVAERADALGREAWQLVRVLERASARLQAEPTPAERPAARRRRFRRAAPPVRETAPQPSARTRFLATKMALTGATPDEIEKRLAGDYGVEGAASVVRELIVTGQLTERG